jgi:hypothetical protein
MLSLAGWCAVFSAITSGKLRAPKTKELLEAQELRAKSLKTKAKAKRPKS